MTLSSDSIEKFRRMKEGGFLFRKRRQPDWNDNYMLYRDKVQLNRLTQRQSVNIPLLKSSIKTLLKDIDDPPIITYINLDNDEQAEIYYNENWRVNCIYNQLILKDIVDKRQVMLFGRSFKDLNIINGQFTWEIGAPEDHLVDRYVDPTDIDTARFVIREHIYVPLSSLMTNPKLDKNAVNRVMQYMGTKQGLIKAEENMLDWIEKNRKFASLGVIDVYNPTLGETYVELNNFHVKEYNPKTKEDEVTFAITAEDMEILFAAPQDEYIGKTKDNFWKKHYPTTTWADETERADFWTDGVGDTLRTLNKVLNAWFSQLVENRTLRNFGMNYFNASLGTEGFTPQTFEPVPWGWYPIPVAEGQKMGDQIMRVDIPDLKDSLEEMNFIMNIAQQASAATNTQEGVKQPGQQVTLGEVQLMLKSAEDRVKSMAVYYMQSWEDFAIKYTKMLEAAPDLLDDTTLYKKGRLTKKIFAKKISPNDYLSKSGYRVEVKMKNDAEAEDVDALQKLQYSKTLMPNNTTLDTIIKRKSLDFAGLSASEMSEVIKEDEIQTKQIQAQMAMAQANGSVMGGQQPGQPPIGGAPPTPQIGAPGQPQPLSLPAPRPPMAA